MTSVSLINESQATITPNKEPQLHIVHSIRSPSTILKDPSLSFASGVEATKRERLTTLYGLNAFHEESVLEQSRQVTFDISA